MSSANTTVINSKPCNFNCGTRIYWDNSSNSYLEVFTKNKHICPNWSSNNMSNNKKIVSNTNSTPTINTANNKNNNKSSYFNSTKKSHYGSQQSKPKMSNSLELISGSVSEVQKKYEILSDIVSEYQGKVHGSQSNVNGNNISLVVYYECPLGKRDEIKTLYNNRIRTLQRFSV